MFDCGFNGLVLLMLGDLLGKLVEENRRLVKSYPYLRPRDALNGYFCPLDFFHSLVMIVHLITIILKLKFSKV